MTNRMRPVWFISLVASIPAVAAPVDFNRDIRPIFNKHCLVCHGGVSKKSGFSLLFESEAKAPAQSGLHAIVPGKPGESELLHRLTTEDKDDRMPSDADPLAPEQVARIRQWIEEGATWEHHWSYIKPSAKSIRAGNGIDDFIGRQLEREGLGFTRPADPATLLRRVTLDLTGLPPTPEEMKAFVGDPTDAAYERAVDRLMASPRFGERWAAMWLDLARYADTQGYEKDNRRTIWPYRDWVIRAFNRDQPFDRFTIDQIAGDLLPNATDAQKVATGFHRNTMTNTEGGTDDEEFRVVAVIDRINTTWEVWMGTSFGCVQCHSHPYDPFRHEDYYRFMAFLNNSADADRNDDNPRMEVLSDRQREIKARLDREIAGHREQVETLSPRMKDTFALWQNELANMKAPEWRVIRPLSATPLHQVKLEILDDGAVLVSGPNPEVNTYTLELPELPEGVSAFRLEALPHESLKKKGPGRAGNGNFVLTEFEVFHGEQRFELYGATASFEQTSAGEATPYGIWSAPGAIDKDGVDPRAGWAIGGGEGKPQQFTVQLRKRLGAVPVRVVLKQNHGNKGHTLGHFRLSVSTSPRPVRSDESVYKPLQALLKKPQADRTPQETRQLVRAFLAESDAGRDHRLNILRKEKQRDGIRGNSTLVMKELSGNNRRKTRVFDRGNWMVHGNEVQPGIPELFDVGESAELHTRLDMARWLVSPDNPLTARVIVNRFWEQLFGIGLVETVEDFGSQGERPVNQPLLDWLALTFQGELNWSVKRLLREMVLSRAYRQSSHVTPGLLERDPYNRWLARGPRFRLPAETIRDQALAAAGLLSPKMFGPSVMPFQPEGVWQVVYNGEQWKTSPGEDRYRRALYTYWRRTSPYPSMMAFDAPSREFCTNRRLRTNTPLAALVTLNDPVYLEAARGIGRRVREEAGDSLDDQLQYACVLVQSRPPAKGNLEALKALYQKTREHFTANPEAARQLADGLEAATWTVVANVLLNLDGTVMKE